MSDDENGVTVTPPERCAIGISFGNSNSSIAHTASVITLDPTPIEHITDGKAGRKGRSHSKRRRRSRRVSYNKQPHITDALRRQTARYLRYFPTLKVKSTMELRQRCNWYEIARTR